MFKSPLKSRFIYHVKKIRISTVQRHFLEEFQKFPRIHLPKAHALLFIPIEASFWHSKICSCLIYNTMI